MSENPNIISKDELQKLSTENKQLDKAAQLKEEILAKQKSALANIQKKPISPATKILTQEELTSNLLSLPNLVETTEDEFEHCVVYGGPGTGKTLAICLLSEFYNILFLDGDKGLRTAIRTLPIEMQKRIKPIRIPDNTSNPMFHNTILKVITGRQVTLCHEHGIVGCPICKTQDLPESTISLNSLPSNWICGMDSITQFVASCCAAINLKATGKSDTVDEFKFTFDEWGVLRQVTEKFGNYLKDLQCHFFAASHDMLVKTEDEKTSKLVPIGGTENASRSFAKYFSTALNCRVFNNKHLYITSSTYNGNIQTKSRSNVKLELEPIPSLLHLLRPDAKELLKGSWNEWFFSDQKKLPPNPKKILEA